MIMILLAGGLSLLFAMLATPLLFLLQDALARLARSETASPRPGDSADASGDGASDSRQHHHAV